jgi:hypothetical protein
LYELYFVLKIELCLSDALLTEYIIIPDTVAQQPPLITQPPIIKDTVTKKSRGVQGITDDDYRIVPTDTTKKKS